MNNNASVNVTSLKLKLNVFDRVDDKINRIIELADMSNSDLKPQEIFSSHSSFPSITNAKSNLVEDDLISIKNNIKAIVEYLNNYLDEMKKVDESPMGGETTPTTPSTDEVKKEDANAKTCIIKEGFIAQIGNLTINVLPGEYKIIGSKYDAHGNLISITIEVDGKKIKLKVVNGKILSPQEMIGKTFETKTRFKGTYNGKKIVINPGKYNITKYHYDSEGNLVGVTIDVNGKEVFLSVKDDKIMVEKVTVKTSTTTVTPTPEKSDEKVDETEQEDEEEHITPVVPLKPKPSGEEDNPDDKKYQQKKTEESSKKNDKIDSSSNTLEITKPIKVVVNGEEIELTSGKYKIVKKYYDASGNLVAIDILVNGKIIRLQISNNKIITPIEIISPKYKITEPFTIKVGNQVITIKPGEYKVIKVIYNEDGTIKAVCIEVDGRKIWLYLDKTGKIARIAYTSETNGIYKIINPTFFVYDMYGNVIGLYREGQYYIYEVLYDQNGNIIGFRLSPDGEYEKWLYPGDNNQDGVYSFFEETVKNNNKSSISFFDKNKTLLGLLGILFVSMGVTLVLKRKNKKKMTTSENEEDIPYDNEWEGELPSGNYAVYEVKKNKDGLVTDARITPDNSEDEYWVEV